MTSKFAALADVKEIESRGEWHSLDLPTTLYEMLSKTAQDHGQRPAVSFQILSGAKDKAETLNWADLHRKVTQSANLFRDLGVGPDDVVAYLLPNSNETVLTLLGAAVAGIANPINPLLEPKQIASILREVDAKVLVTLKAFPKSDIAEKAAEAVKDAPNVKTVLEVDLNRYLTPPKSWIVPFVRPKTDVQHNAQVRSFNAEIAKMPTTLSFEDMPEDRVAAYFHTGGTTGMPKVARHKYSGMIYNAWLGNELLFTPEDNVICPLPLFHVFAVHVILMAMIRTGSHVVFPTPAGYRGDGVFDNFWKLIERWNITFIITVPTAISALMQRPVDADISSVKSAFSGSSPLPLELFHRFQKATNINIIEGYGLTEATCLVSCNPIEGEKKIGSVGVPFPHTDVRILKQTSEGAVIDCEPGEVGEICIFNPGVIPGGTYTEDAKNKELYHLEKYLRTGDLGRIDEDGYLWITGRSKDLIIRSGHNIDPALIEEALACHDAVAMAGAIGQPDAYAGETPAAFVELVAGASVTEDELMEFAKSRIPERAAHPKHMEILDELPKTAVGKVFKPDLRKSAITRIYNKALTDAGLSVQVVQVVEDKKRGLVAQVSREEGVNDADISSTLGTFTFAWDWCE